MFLKHANVTVKVEDSTPRPRSSTFLDLYNRVYRDLMPDLREILTQNAILDMDRDFNDSVDALVTSRHTVSSRPINPVDRSNSILANSITANDFRDWATHLSFGPGSLPTAVNVPLNGTRHLNDVYYSGERYEVHFDRIVTDRLRRRRPKSARQLRQERFNDHLVDPWGHDDP